MDLALVGLLGLALYLLGSVPSAYILVRLLKGVDIRELGSRNVGALNTFQQVGAWAGLLVLGIDTAKGALAVLVPVWAGAPAWTVLLTGPLVVAGHNWPVFLGFRGGKGAAAILGVSLALLPWLTLIALGPACLLALLLRNVVLGAALGFLVVNALLLVTSESADVVALCIALTLLVTITYLISIWRHITTSIKARDWRELFLGLP